MVVHSISQNIKVFKMISGRALHYVFKIPDRKSTSKFYRDVLGMKVLRHEEFKEGCEATCNGPYDGRWSKTMVGYGPEDTHFAIELTYNYGVSHYKKGNDFIGITIKSKEALQRADQLKWPINKENGVNYLEAPGGYKFYILDEPQPTDTDPVRKVSLACSNLKQSVEYWKDLLGLNLFEEDKQFAVLGFNSNKAKLQLIAQDGPIKREQAFGRIAFSCPFDQQPLIDKTIREANKTILTPLTSLDTPGKATVRVIILADPDGHEICFVDDEAFKQLSQIDSEAAVLLDRYIAKDPSN